MSGGCNEIVQGMLMHSKFPLCTVTQLSLRQLCCHHGDAVEIAAIQLSVMTQLRSR